VETAVVFGGNLFDVGERIVRELALLREALGDLGNRLTDRFSEERPEVWEEEWDMEEDEEWVKRESAELLAEKLEYREFLKKRGEATVEEGNRGKERETEGEAEVEIEGKDGEEEEEGEEVNGESVGAKGPTEN
jgi:hypothetical protein